MQSRPTQVASEVLALLPGTTYADAFQLDVPKQNLDAVTAAKAALDHVPLWIAGLMRLRNALVRPLGLKTAAKGSVSKAPRIGFFPIIAESPSRVVLGFDDRHLDFRIVVDTAVRDAGTLVTGTTLVRTHNLLGRAYLTAILPFHRAIVPAMLEQNAARR